jgi:hypothetical protein
MDQNIDDMVPQWLQATEKIIKHKGKHEQGAEHPSRDIGHGSIIPLKELRQVFYIFYKKIIGNGMEVVKRECVPEGIGICDYAQCGYYHNKYYIL